MMRMGYGRKEWSLSKNNLMESVKEALVHEILRKTTM
jgi:hypothetical protein